MKIWIYTLCYNEMEILPFVIDYWKNYADKVIVYDNGSTDGSIEYLQQYDWIEVRDFDTNGSKQNARNRDLKNKCWKDAKLQGVDFVQVCDIDEVLYSPNGVKNELQRLKDLGCTLWVTDWYELICEKFPTYEDGKLIHQLDDVYATYIGKPRIKFQSKYVLFNPDDVKDTNYDVGSHHAKFSGTIREMVGEKLCLLHLNRIGKDFIERKYKKNRERISTFDKSQRWGTHYFYDKKRLETDFNNIFRLRKKLD